MGVTIPGQSGRECYRCSGRRRRILIYLAAASLWISIALDNRSGLDGLLSASLLTAFALAFWGAYCIFPEVLDALRTHFGRRVPR